MTRTTIRTAAKGLAQDPAGRSLTGLGVQLLLADPGDYDLAILQALRIHDTERPNVRIVDHTLAAAGFRFVLAGSGALSSLAGGDAWIDGSSSLDDVFLPWDPTSQGAQPLDRNLWRIMRDPGPKVILELLDQSGGVGQVMRLAFRSPHTLTEAPNTVTAPTAAPVTALASPAAPGSVDNGSHSYVYTWTTLHGETTPSPAAAPVTVADKTTNGKVTITVPASLDGGITGAKVYRTVAGDTGSRKLVGTITSADGSGVLTDNVADSGLGAVAPAANTAGGANTVLDGDADAFATLTASVILELAAIKAVQNTGNTGLPNDVVDRRSQSDIFRSRSKELREIYKTLIGTMTGEDGPGAASGWADLDVPILSPVGPLWHTANRR